MIYFASENNIKSLLEIESQCFKECDRFSERKFRYLMKYSNRNRFIILDKASSKEIYGYASLIITKNTLRIYSLAIKPCYQRCGIGSLGMSFIEKEAIDSFSCNRIILEVRQDNLDAIKFYTNHGYKQYGIKHNYYDDGMDAILMEKDGLHAKGRMA